LKCFVNSLGSNLFAIIFSSVERFPKGLTS
jgi:hypothetical protein